MAIREQLISAIDLALAGDWEAAHAIVQKHDNDSRANLIHALLHIQEGDNDNAMYWYRRAGVDGATDADPERQLLELREELLQQA